MHSQPQKIPRTKASNERGAIANCSLVIFLGFADGRGKSLQSTLPTTPLFYYKIKNSVLQQLLSVRRTYFDVGFIWFSMM